MFEEHGMKRSDVLVLLDELLAEDMSYTSGRPVASMSTVPHEIGVEVFGRTMEKNAGRFHTFRGSYRIEQQLLEMIGDLLHLRHPYGVTTSGGTESNILAMLAARELGRQKTESPEVIVPQTIHASVDKAAWLLGVRLIKTDVDSEFRAQPERIEQSINENTVGIFVTAGTTYLGQVDPVEEVATIAREYELPLHVDAAFGGFVIPFLRELGLGNYPFDFEVNGVTSISIDAHKMGLAPIPAGSLLFLYSKMLKSITREVPYLRGTSSQQSTLLGSRPAGSIIASWAIMKELGREGYSRLVANCMHRTERLVTLIDESDHLHSAIRPIMNIVGVVTERVSPHDVADEMERRNWSMAVSPLPPTLRVILMPHVTDSVVDSFIKDLNDVVTSLRVLTS